LLDYGEGGEVRAETVEDTVKAGIVFEPRSAIVRFDPGRREACVDKPLLDNKNIA
jgi:hypothetical protein